MWGKIVTGETKIGMAGTDQTGNEQMGKGRIRLAWLERSGMD
jgi:hypothetical protein